jgi:hypothetical protein
MDGARGKGGRLNHLLYLSSAITVGGRRFFFDTNGGCYIQDMVNACTLQGSAGKVRSCVQHTTDYLLKAGE